MEEEGSDDASGEEDKDCMHAHYIPAVLTQY